MRLDLQNTGVSSTMSGWSRRRLVREVVVALGEEITKDGSFRRFFAGFGG